MNSDFVMEQSKALAKKLAESSGDDTARINAAYRLLFQREPAPKSANLLPNFCMARPMLGHNTRKFC